MEVKEGFTKEVKMSWVWKEKKEINKPRGRERCSTQRRHMNNNIYIVKATAQEAVVRVYCQGREG